MKVRQKHVATLITGNPKYIANNPLAEAYYDQITLYLENKGFYVIRDPGEDFTCPPKSDLYVAHSRGVGRFLKFGDLDGISHPKDRVYQERYRDQFKNGTDVPPPPDEHYLFMDEQKKEIDRLAKKVRRLPSVANVEIPISATW